MTEKDLIKTAKAAAKMSYSPYSNCRVGAALLCDNGKVYTGCNIEKHLCKLFTKEDRDNCRRCLMTTKTEIIAGICRRHSQKVGILVHTDNDSGQEYQKL